MRKKNLLILSLFFVLSVSYCIAYADLAVRPRGIPADYKANVAKTVKPERGSLENYKIEYKEVKAVITNDRNYFSIRYNPNKERMEILVKKGDFVTKGQKIAVKTDKSGNKKYEIKSPISAYVTDDKFAGDKHGSYIPLESEFVAKFQIAEKDLKYVREGDIVNVILSSYPERKIKGYLLVGYVNSLGRFPGKEPKPEDYRIYRRSPTEDGTSCYVAPLNPLSKEEKEFIKTGNSVNVILPFPNGDIYLVPNEFVYKHNGSKYVIYAGGEDYRREQVITGISDDKYTEVFYPDISNYELVVFKDNAKKEFILKNGKTRVR